MKTATKIRQFDNTTNEGGSRVLWLLSEPHEGNVHVVTSATRVLGDPETYIFGSDDKGEITNWSELSGSYKGGLDHVEAITGAGYAVA